MKKTIIFCITLLMLDVAIGIESDCSAKLRLSDPLATPETKALYRNLHKVAQKGILFGHEDTLAYGVGWKSTKDDFDSEPVPIIFRPYHEHNGDWFWWGAKWCTPDEYKQLWRLTIDYLRKTKGLHNIITCYSPDRFKDRTEYLERYPGDDVIDIIGHDNYGNFRSIKTKDQARQALETIVALAQERNKIAAFTETGVGQRDVNATWWTDVLLETLKSSPSTRKIAWVLVWRNAGKRQNYAAFPGSATVESFKTFEADPLTLFMEDLPRMYE